MFNNSSGDYILYKISRIKTEHHHAFIKSLFIYNNIINLIMEKRKPTIDEIYKLNVDGLFESTANWFDNAFKKSQAEINRDLYNKINGYSSSSESTGGNVSLGPLLNSLNGSNLYPSRGYLYYNGNDWEFNAPTVSGGGGGIDGSIVITKGSHSFTIELDDNGNLKFNGNIYATGGITALGVGTTTGGGSSVSLGTLLTKLNSDNPFPTDNGQVLTYDGTNFVWKTPTGGSGSSSRIDTIKLFNSAGTSFETINLGSANKIGFMAGNNVSLEAVVKEYTNVIKISATGGSGGSGGSTSTSVSWQDITNKPSTFTPSSHTHSTSDISGLSSYVQGVKVSNATNADKLANSRTIWGQSFNGTSNINGNLYMSAAGSNSIQLWMNNGNMLDRTNNTLHIGYALKESSDGEINLDANVTKIFTNNYSKHYDFKSNVFDVNSNQIHFGSETNGGKISWDTTNNAFKIEGNVYATGGITALGVSNNATTSNNVDFTFRNVTANTFNVMNSIQLSDNLKLTRDGNNINLVNTDSVNEHWLYINTDELYGLSSNGNVYANRLVCDAFSFGQADNFEIVDANNRSFTIQFVFAGKTYRFTPSGDNVTVS